MLLEIKSYFNKMARLLSYSDVYDENMSKTLKSPIRYYLGCTEWLMQLFPSPS